MNASTEHFPTVGESLMQALAAEAPAERASTAGRSASPSGRTRRGGKTLKELAFTYVMQMPASVSGQGGHKAAWRVACKLMGMFGLSIEDALEVMLQWNEQRAQPAWSESELRHKLEDAQKKADDEPSDLLRADRRWPADDDDFDASTNEFLPVPSGGKSDNANPLDGLSLDLDVSPDGEALSEIPSSIEFKPDLSALERPDIPEEIDDPDFLGPEVIRRNYLHHHGVTLRLSGGDFFEWAVNQWKLLSIDRLNRGIREVALSLFRAEYAAQVEAAKSNPNVKVPKKRKVTRNLVAEVIESIKRIIPLDDPSLGWTDGPYRDRDQRDFISLSNGILDLQALFDESNRGPHLIRHSPLWFAESCVPYPYDPKATCPTWTRFLTTNLQDDDEQIRVLQEWFGYCLTQDTSQQKFLMMEGKGKNGKSVILAALTAVLGEANVSHVPLELFEQSFQLGATIGKLANIAAEIGEVDRVAEGVLKSFTSGDKLTIDRKYKSPISVAPTARLVFATNNRPRFSDRSDGLWRRMILLPLTYQVPDDQRVHGMDRPEFWASEVSGIFNWALAGLWELRQWGRFTEPDAMKEQVADYKREVNPAQQFLEERCRHSPGRNVSKADVYAAYRSWALTSGYQPLAEISFGKEVGRQFPEVRSGKVVMEYTTGKRRLNSYYDLELLPAENENEFV